MKPRKRDQINGEMDTLWILKFYDNYQKKFDTSLLNCIHLQIVYPKQFKHT